MRLVLIEPEIPQNTGNIGRLAVAIGAELILVGRLGFSLDEKKLRRAGMDYWKNINLTLVPSVDAFLSTLRNNYAFISTKGDKTYTSISAKVDTLIFGNESKGLPDFIYSCYQESIYRIPMCKGVRSLNLSTSAGIVAYYSASLNAFSQLK